VEGRRGEVGFVVWREKERGRRWKNEGERNARRENVPSAGGTGVPLSTVTPCQIAGHLLFFLWLRLGRGTQRAP